MRFFFLSLFSSKVTFDFVTPWTVAHQLHFIFMSFPHSPHQEGDWSLWFISCLTISVSCLYQIYKMLDITSGNNIHWFVFSFSENYINFVTLLTLSVTMEKMRAVWIFCPLGFSISHNFWKEILGAGGSFFWRPGKSFFKFSNLAGQSPSVEPSVWNFCEVLCVISVIRLCFSSHFWETLGFFYLWTHLQLQSRRIGNDSYPDSGVASPFHSVPALICHFRPHSLCSPQTFCQHLRLKFLAEVSSPFIIMYVLVHQW